MENVEHCSLLEGINMQNGDSDAVVKGQSSRKKGAGLKIEADHLSLKQISELDPDHLMVKDIRKFIPKLLNHVYHGDGMRKMPGLWDPVNKPEDWPEHIEFSDPNNKSKIKGVKPGKETLKEIFKFLVNKYLEFEKVTDDDDCVPHLSDYQKKAREVLKEQYTRILNKRLSIVQCHPLPDVQDKINQLLQDLDPERFSDFPSTLFQTLVKYLHQLEAEFDVSLGLGLVETMYSMSEALDQITDGFRKEFFQVICEEPIEELEVVEEEDDMCTFDDPSTLMEIHSGETKQMGVEVSSSLMTVMVVPEGLSTVSAMELGVPQSQSVGPQWLKENGVHDDPSLPASVLMLKTVPVELSLNENDTDHRERNLAGLLSKRSIEKMHSEACVSEVLAQTREMTLDGAGVADVQESLSPDVPTVLDNAGLESGEPPPKRLKQPNPMVVQTNTGTPSSVTGNPLFKQSHQLDDDTLISMLSPGQSSKPGQQH